MPRDCDGWDIICVKRRTHEQQQTLGVWPVCRVFSPAGGSRGIWKLRQQRRGRELQWERRWWRWWWERGGGGQRTAVFKVAWKQAKAGDLPAPAAHRVPAVAHAAGRPQPGEHDVTSLCRFFITTVWSRRAGVHHAHHCDTVYRGTVSDHVVKTSVFQASRRYFVASFLGSILWIGVFSYLMVWWAHQVGWHLTPQTPQTICLIFMMSTFTTLGLTLQCKEKIRYTCIKYM